MAKILAKDVFDKHLYIKCDCGSEIIEFVKDGNSYFVWTHFQWDRKLDSEPDFFFPSPDHFKVFIKSFIDMLQDKAGGALHKEVKCVGLDNTSVLTCYRNMNILNRDTNRVSITIGIRKYRSERKYEKNRPTWEVIISEELVPQLIQELESFLED